MTKENQKLDYRVDVDGADNSITMVKEQTRRTAVDYCVMLNDIGGFGALWDMIASAKKLGILYPICAIGADGIGTKIMIGKAIEKLDTLGQDLVAMCVNDVICQGAQPITFLDYIATGKFDEKQLEILLEGMVRACIEAGCQIVGGETAEMQDMYAEGDFDAAGFVNGVVEKSNILPQPGGMEIGDVVIALPSNGIHSNGLTAIRDLVEKHLKMDWNDPAPFNKMFSIGEIFLEPTKLYVKPVLEILKEFPQCMGLANITGGGMVTNPKRMFGDRKDLQIKFNYDEIEERRSKMFTWLHEQCLEFGMTEEKYRKSFNDGIGMVMHCPANVAEKMIKSLEKKHINAFICGEIIAA